MSAQQIFAEIYTANLWGDPESRSGPGSSVFRTRLLRPALSRMFSDLAVLSVLDLPCGDFNWMRLTEMPGVQYIGADIVSDIVERNAQLYGDVSRSFSCIDMTVDPLPSADLILCRDGLVHLSFDDIAAALRQMRSSGATWLLATTFEAHGENQDIETGDWRPLNLEVRPFAFPPPVSKIWDGPRPDGTYADKMLALYRLADVPAL